MACLAFVVLCQVSVSGSIFLISELIQIVLDNLHLANIGEA